MSGSPSTCADTSTQPSPSLRCSLCEHSFEVEERLFRCHPCHNGDFSVCQACVRQESFSDQGHYPRPCFLDCRDGRTTFLQAPDVTQYKELVSSAKADQLLKLPAQTQKFLSRSFIEGVTTERLTSSTAYETEEDDLDTPMLKHTIVNDYSLYRKLDTHSKDIRLMMLMPGQSEAHISVMLGRFSSPWTQIPFMALSYRWGELDETRPIQVMHMTNRMSDGNKPEYETQALRVTANLEIALRAIRGRCDKPVWIWVDAICINQGDAQERADQVRMMAEIYAHASTTIVWLQTDKEEAESLQLIQAFLNYLKLEKERVAQAGEISFMIELIRSFRITIGNKQMTHGEVCQKMVKLFRNPWFTRVWVLQEVANTTTMVLILTNVATSAIQWSELQFVQNYVIVGNKYVKAGVACLPSPWDDIARLMTSHTAKSSSLLSITDLFAEASHNFDATDQRDTLFALLSIAKETRDLASLSPLIQPDYTKSVAQVFTDFTRWCIYHHRTLQVLGHVTYSQRKSTSINKGHKFPSWAWSPLKRYRSHQYVLCETEEFRAAANTEVDFSLLSDRLGDFSLRLRGYRLITVIDAEKCYFDIRWDEANELYLQEEGSDRFYFGGLHWLWRSACGPNGQQARSCEPLPGHDVCSGRYAFDEFLLMLTCGGLQRHGDCNHSAGIHRSRWLKPTEMYEMFAAYYVNHGANWADPHMELFCPHVRDLLKPLASQGDPEAFVEMMIGIATRKTLIAMDGRAGLGPPGTRKGDIIVALFGGNAPFVLRPCDNEGSEDEEWEFIGECFINGLMDGKHVQDKIDRREPSEIFNIC